MTFFYARSLRSLAPLAGFAALRHAARCCSRTSSQHRLRSGSPWPAGMWSLALLVPFSYFVPLIRAARQLSPQYRQKPSFCRILQAKLRRKRAIFLVYAARQNEDVFCLISAAPPQLVFSLPLFFLPRALGFSAARCAAVKPLVCPSGTNLKKG